MTIKQYLKKENISLRELARRLNISAVYLSDLRDRKRQTISKKVADKFKEVAPEIDITEEEKIIYKIKEAKDEI